MVLFDSSDGVLIATEDFFDDGMVRSHFQVQVHAVADRDLLLVADVEQMSHSVFS